MITSIFTASLIGGSIAGILGVVLILADKFIADYGTCEISINGKRKILANGGKSLLNTLQEEKIYIPSSCGGKGTCGLCKVKILSGGGDILPTELPVLTKREVREKIRLACQVKIRKDISISLPEWILGLKLRTLIVKAISDLNYDTKSILLKIADGGSFDFTPGQYIQIQVPSTNEFRAYSIASKPKDSDIELIIRQVEGGLCTTYVHEHLKVGEEIHFLGPCGDFTFKDGSSREIILIAGGSGLAPMKSILAWCFENDVKRRISLFFGAVTKDDLYLVDELMAWAQTHSNFTFTPALSAPTHTDNWNGETGLITDAVKRNIKDAKDKEVYLCGSTGMIDAAIKTLQEIGFNEEDIHCDRFA